MTKRRLLRRTLAVLVLGVSSLTAQVIDIGLYGWLNQYSFGTGTNEIGGSACVPTASVNALAFLQNAYPSVYGSSLAGATYNDWENTGALLIDRMGTLVGEGTDTPRILPALQNYLWVEQGFGQTTFSSMMAAGNFSDDETNFDLTGSPTVSFLQAALAQNQAVIAGYTYTDFAGGHAITVNGIEWDAVLGSGTLYFIDPLDAFGDYDGALLNGPAKQSTGRLSLTESGCLQLDYEQYWGVLPHTSQYGAVSAYLDVAIVVGVIPEPSSYGLLVCVCVLVCTFRRRRECG
jgi:hypothetical protein